MTFNILHLTGEQIRAARALARIEQTDLARRASLSLETIKRLERIRGAVEANARTLRSIQTAFEAIGIHFHGDESGAVGVIFYPSNVAANPETGRLPAASSASRLRRLIFHGRLRDPNSQSLRPSLAGLHFQVSALNKELGLTGLTLALDGAVLQAIEGDSDKVETAYQRLKSCHDHGQLTLMDDRPASHRVFGNLDFYCGLFAEDLSGPDQGPVPSLPFRPETMTATEAMGLLMAAGKRLRQLPRKGCLVPASCTLSSACMDRRCNETSQQIDPRLTPGVQSANSDG